MNPKRHNRLLLLALTIACAAILTPLHRADAQITTKPKYNVIPEPPINWTCDVARVRCLFGFRPSAAQIHIVTQITQLRAEWAELQKLLLEIEQQLKDFEQLRAYYGDRALWAEEERINIIINGIFEHKSAMYEKMDTLKDKLAELLREVDRASDHSSFQRKACEDAYLFCRNILFRSPDAAPRPDMLPDRSLN